MDEEVIVQDVKSKNWDKEGTITDVRTAYDVKIVSYDLLINGSQAIRHRRYLRKKVDSEHHDSELDESDSQTGSEPEREQGPRRSSRNLRQQ